MGFDLMHVFQYFVIVSGTMIIMNFFSAHVSSIIGMKRTIVLRIPILLVFLFLLTNINVLPFYFLYLTAIIGGTSSAFYWIPLNSVFTKNADKKKEGVETGYYSALPKIFVVLAPIIGGIILLELGFHYVFILVMILAILSVIPLLLTKDRKIKLKYDKSS